MKTENFFTKNRFYVSELSGTPAEYWKTRVPPGLPPGSQKPKPKKQNRKKTEKVWHCRSGTDEEKIPDKDGGAIQSRTELHEFAIRCITALLSRPVFTASAASLIRRTANADDYTEKKDLVKNKMKFSENVNVMPQGIPGAAPRIFCEDRQFLHFF